MGRQGKDFGGSGGERRFEGGRGQDFKSRGGRPDSGERRGGYNAGGSDSRGGSYGDRNGGGRSFGGDRDRGAGSFERRGPSSFGGRDDRPQQRSSGPGQYRRPEGAQGGYGRPSAPRYDDAPRRPAPAAAPAAMAAPKAPVVGAAQLKAGIGQANRALAEVIEQFGHTLRGDYDIGAIEVTVSFAEDGRFLGFGAGGAACMKLSLTPLDAEAVMEGESADDDFVSLDDEEDEAVDEVAMSDGNGVDAGNEAQQFDA